MTDRLIPSETPIGDELAVSRAAGGPAADRAGASARPRHRTLQAARAARRDGDRRHRRAADRADRYRGREQPHHAPEEGRRAISPHAANRPAAGDHEIDCRGKWVTPGFIDCHAHAGVPNHAANGWVPPVDYVYKLWLAHGVTTVREMGSMNGLGWMLDQKKRSAENSIAAPRLLAYAYFPAVNDMLKVHPYAGRGADLAAQAQGTRRRRREVLRRAARHHGGGARRMRASSACARAAITPRCPSPA